MRSLRSLRFVKGLLRGSGVYGKTRRFTEAPLHCACLFIRVCPLKHRGRGWLANILTAQSVIRRHATSQVLTLSSLVRRLSRLLITKLQGVTLLRENRTLHRFPLFEASSLMRRSVWAFLQSILRIPHNSRITVLSTVYTFRLPMTVRRRRMNSSPHSLRRRTLHLYGRRESSRLCPMASRSRRQTARPTPHR